MARGRKKTLPLKGPEPSPSTVAPERKSSTPLTPPLAPSPNFLEQEPQQRAPQEKGLPQRAPQAHYHVQPQKQAVILPTIPDYPSPQNLNHQPPQNFGHSLAGAEVLDHYHPRATNPQPAPFNHLSGIILPDPIAIPPPHMSQPSSTHHHLQNYHPNPAHLEASAGLSHPPPPPQAPDSAPGNYTYANLTDGIVGHIFFPLVLKKIFEHFAQQQLPAAQSADHFEMLEDRALELKKYGEMCGLEGACEKYASVDLFMSAMVTSLSGLPEKVNAGSIDPLLADTLSVASASFRNGPGPGATATGRIQNAAEAGNSSGFPHKSQHDGVAPGSGVAKPPVQRDLEDVHNAARRKLRPHARKCLEEWFQAHLESPYPSDVEKQALATQCQLELQQVCLNHMFRVDGRVICRFDGLKKYKRDLTLPGLLLHSLHLYSILVIFRSTTTLATKECVRVSHC